MRLNRYLAACGIGSRRRCEELVTAGRVQVNGVRAALATRVEAGDTVCVDGRSVQPVSNVGIWLLHKPAGVVCTARDERGRRTVVDLARERGVAVRVFPVGRLDLETTGLLLLTNDGGLAHRLMHPSHGVEKEYEAHVAAPLAAATLGRLRTGIELDDGWTSPCRVEQERDGTTTRLRLVLHEGRKRQVRRMLAAVGAPVLALHRVRVGPIRLGALAPGELRAATADEWAALRAAAGLDPEPFPERAT